MRCEACCQSAGTESVESEVCSERTAPLRPLNYSSDLFMWQAAFSGHSTLSYHQFHIRQRVEHVTSPLVLQAVMDYNVSTLSL